GTVVGRPIWDTEGARLAAQPIARPAWSDADDTEADSDDQTAQQGERRTIGIVDAADGDGAMAMDMMDDSTVVARSSNITNTPAAVAVATSVEGLQ
ncbi:hypothetical protein FRC11_003757, partial [Ceratobasidium sp. 423]